MNKGMQYAGRALSLAMIALGVLHGSSRALAQSPVPTTIALPAQSLLFAPLYIAQERGFFRKHGIEPKVIYVAGPGVINAMLGKSADFSLISGGIQIAAAARNQKLVAIANTQDRFTTDIVIRDAVAKKLEMAPNADAMAKIRALKGLTIGVDAINGLPHSFLRFVAIKAGMNPETDFTITALQPPAMVAALKAGTIDAMVFSPPFSLLAVKEGGVRWLSGPEVSLPELKPFPYNVVLVRPGYCDAETLRCQGFVAALKDAIALMKTDRSASLEALGKSFDKMEPDILKASYEVFAPFAQPDMKLTSAMLDNVIAFDRVSGIIPPDAKLPLEAELYLTAFTP
ncbi:ABC transporter substrate-binding protein [Bradyrhizobium japonicum]|uniref:ABC transporter substrate-binding protein n=1 Tax=Bradyrhizobium japonicum TaxID=375 RepID=UPI001BAA050F|nr:ABC transporter substrate-binding protein [Bradyrhizobium japonicum]MBR0803428.1 ABC transporter substrate-binding protein [Bradyrhizobium japonicum]UQD76166.1 ABC transporter substrate-binding protein [Bradyrhizobium japonicum]